jgi:succinate dehydrogenase cytochrome b556 subunit
MVKKRPYSTGIWAWLFQRITGLLLVLYLAAHLWSIHFSSIETPLDRLFTYLMSRSFFPILLALLTYHALNGFRVFAIDLGLGTRGQRFLFWALVVVGGAIILFWAL